MYHMLDDKRKKWIDNAVRNSVIGHSRRPCPSYGWATGEWYEKLMREWIDILMKMFPQFRDADVSIEQISIVCSLASMIVECAWEESHLRDAMGSNK